MEAVGAGWRSGPLLVARRRWERWRGLRPRPQGRGLVLAGRSVHSFGMAEPLRVVSLDALGRVRRAALLRPGHLFLDPGARWLLELPASRPIPRVGMTLQPVRAVLAAAGDSCSRPMLDSCPGR